ncbi:MarR family transcriptional regulator [Candidatus Ozemobacteraceae bacterium]|nr:MarR family transcriptional regulator [Candidatus Ozemobacteraceae bacterium]
MGTHYKGTPEETRALDVFIKLLRAADSVSRRTRDVISSAGLTESRFGVLESLYHLGPLSPGELGRKILKTAGNLTLVIDNLERDGLVERRSGLNDRRVKRVALTLKGRDLIERLLPPHAKLITSEMAVLTAGEQRELARLCKKLGLKK